MMSMACFCTALIPQCLQGQVMTLMRMRVITFTAGRARGGAVRPLVHIEVVADHFGIGVGVEHLLVLLVVVRIFVEGGDVDVVVVVRYRSVGVAVVVVGYR